MALKPALKRTKILATYGPASSSPEVLESMAKAGVNGFRLNMSHGQLSEHAAFVKTIRKISGKLSKPIALVADLQGPRIRLGQLPAEGLAIVAGSEYRFGFGDSYEGGVIPVQHDIAKYMKKGQPVYLKDGMVQLEVESVSKGVVKALAKTPGVVVSKQGMNLPETDLGGEILTEKDLDDLFFICKQDIDFIALSFVQTAADIERLRDLVKRHKGTASIIAKIETRAAADNLRPIIEASDGVMVARGDLAIETKPEMVPALQQRIIQLAKEQQKIAIVATQMLDSMITSPQPTRAEVSDVATAVVQGADAVMLSGESAVGKYPIETVALMRRVIVYTETNRMESITATHFGDTSKQNAISAAAITLAGQIGARLILAETSSGQTARNLCSFRPEAMVVAVTHTPRVYQQLALLWGARSYLISDMSKAAEETLRMLRQEHNVVRGETIIKASGSRPGVTGGTDKLELEVV